jgi:hypothetical protein
MIERDRSISAVLTPDILELTVLAGQYGAKPLARNFKQFEWLDLVKSDWLNQISKLKLDDNTYATTNRMYSGES